MMWPDAQTSICDDADFLVVRRGEIIAATPSAADGATNGPPTGLVQSEMDREETKVPRH